jgi:hypothetical protein
MVRRILPLVLCVFAGPALAEELPARKSGLWEMKMSMEGRQMPPQTMQQCIDATTDAEMRQPPGMENVDMTKACKQDITRAGETMTVDSACNINGRSTKSHMTITGSFESAYSMKVAVSSDPPSPGGEMHMTMEGKYLGACKPDQKPGDMIMGGMKINISDMKKMRAGGPPPGMPPR